MFLEISKLVYLTDKLQLSYLVKFPACKHGR